MIKSETASRSKGATPPPGFEVSSSGFHRPKKNLVGSAKAGLMNYLRDMRAFSRDYVPEEVRNVVAEVKDSITLDILGVKASRWNTSTYVAREKPYEAQMNTDKRHFEVTFSQIRHGLRDETVVEKRSNKIYLGTDGRDNYQGWNVSTEITDKQIRIGLNEL